jgi:3-oxoacyl-[acyl-carrier protein] reductase
MDLGLTGRSVAVLGAGSGLGRATALAFADEGALVTVFGRRTETLEAVAKEAAGRGAAPVGVVAGDLRSADDLESLAHAAADAGDGAIWALVVNGGGPPPGGFDAFDDAAWRDAFESTLLGYVRTIRVCLPWLRAGGGGRILANTSSAKAALDGLILSNVFRLGVLGLARSLATELAPDGILVNAIAPGKFDTERITVTDRARARRTGRTLEAVRAANEAAIPLGRYGSPEEFARAAVFHCSAANTYVTGQLVLADGGAYQGY